MNTLFGDLKDDKCIIFIIDTSITMVNEKFTFDNENFISRLDSVQEELINCIQNLRENQSFNILKYNKKCISFMNDCVLAT